MEEVDNIIIDSLRNIHCDIDDDINSLREFTADLVFTAIVCCLESITPGVKFPHKLPPSMSLRLKLATNIAEHIKELGYRGDMGYQTILYCNEVETRRVLMFLVERLPRDTSKTTVSEELGYVPRLIKEIENRIKLSFEKPWVPNCLLKDGMRDCGNTQLRQDFSHGFPLQTENIRIPSTQGNYSEALKKYWVHNLPDVTKQCNPRNLIPSLLYKDSEFSINCLNLSQSLKVDEDIANIDVTTNTINETNVTTDVSLNGHPVEENAYENKIQCLLQYVNNNKSKFKELQEKQKILEAKLAQVSDEKTKKETSLKEAIARVKTKSKALTVLSNEENMIKLRNLVENGSKRLIELANQWNQVQTPLLTQHHELQQNLSAQETKVINEQQKLQNLKEKNHQLSTELKEKDKLEQQLLQEYEKLSKNTNRSAYTRRILEIIGNIKKQNEEIQKVLKDTKTIQKDINNLNGQLDRSFTLSDELIFRDAKRDEMARKAYKLLATLHTDCGEVVQAVTDLGLVERECRNLQEQVDAELAREISTKLERVNADLAEVKKETTALIKQMKEQL
ncbi:hypothetical protein ILUMI_22064 [Ignelater luminosus]|uniref:Coiled-coil domain-containing protein 22 homolog n=1 Tax=Ignelater luminosus TaxID=2038154 RepID=A0A8K0CF75_IGNLU|nr:hypothetical protein ILUMI_22064 [Ignelater luminosus]